MIWAKRNAIGAAAPGVRMSGLDAASTKDNVSGAVLAADADSFTSARVGTLRSGTVEGNVPAAAASATRRRFKENTGITKVAPSVVAVGVVLVVYVFKIAYTACQP